MRAYAFALSTGETDAHTTTLQETHDRHNEVVGALRAVRIPALPLSWIMNRVDKSLSDIHLSNYLYLYIYPAIDLAIHLSIYLYLYLSIHLDLYL